MKIILSHDVDSLMWKEHWLSDLLIPKWIVKNISYGIRGHLPWNLIMRRIAAPVAGGRINCLQDVMAIDKVHAISSTFFVAMANGNMLSYNIEAATEAVKMLRSGGFNVGVHGIAYQDGEGVKNEYLKFRNIVGEGYPIGIRNHYLNRDENTLQLQANAGYLFDTTEYGLKKPYRLGAILETPLCLMDSHILAIGKNDLSEVQEKTLFLLKQAEQQNLPVFTILFHDLYFSDLFPVHSAWYLWLLDYITVNYETTDFISVCEAY